MGLPTLDLPLTAAAAAVDRDVRCWRCGKKLALLLTRPWSITCHRCHAANQSE